jgi:hypothetical protein
MYDLSEAQVTALLEGYDPPETTIALRDFGTRLVDEIIQRHDKLDSKAGALAGYSGAVVALLVSTIHDWRQELDSWAIVLVCAAALVAILSAGLALWAMAPRKFRWFSDEEWFPSVLLNQPEALQRYYLKVMHQTVSSHSKQAAAKAGLVRVAQLALVVVGTLLLAAFVDAASRQVGNL